MRPYILIPIVFLLFSCTYENRDPETGQNTSANGVFLDIPEDFDYSTHREVTIEITDAVPNIRYDIFNYPDTPQYKGIETY
jgi:hypothetical protein